MTLVRSPGLVSDGRSVEVALEWSTLKTEAPTITNSVPARQKLRDGVVRCMPGPKDHDSWVSEPSGAASHSRRSCRIVTAPSLFKASISEAPPKKETWDSDPSGARRQTLVSAPIGRVNAVHPPVVT